MSLKIGLKLTRKYSINFTLPKRSKKMIKFVIIHYTGMKSESSAIKKLCDTKSKVSSHYYVKYNGDILQMVPDLYNAWHAGKSTWKNYNSINKYSIGIEISNPGHQYNYKKYTRQQITSIKKLLKYLITKYNINRQAILGHSDIAPDRKRDPGEKFPWNELAKIKLSWTHSLDTKKLIKFRNMKLSLNSEKNFFLNNLRKLGYMRINTVKSKKKINFLVKSFQRRFRQDLVNGIIDKECFLISKNLLKQ
tara:strand:+ start:3166 stop:3912 length:747 start_codon:yes stop_codon:yes gene_type:complete